MTAPFTSFGMLLAVYVFLLSVPSGLNLKLDIPLF